MGRQETLELLSPARDANVAIVAIDAGADAVYMGGPTHGARAAAGNTIDDIRRVCEYAHRFRARVYVTVNTIIYDDELDDVRNLVRELYLAGVDALIVQDMSLLEMDLSPIALHASTQCDIRTADKARMLAKAGMSQLVLPREFTLEQISQIHDAVPDTPLEVFVHGALCVSYSGDCRASLVCGGRSANRGECAQICRLPYTLTDEKGNVVGKTGHYLSLRDLNRVEHLEALALSGARSFKIEGRLKDTRYVRTVTAAYSRALDSLCSRFPDRYVRASVGKTEHTFQADLKKAFNRGFTNYFLMGAKPEKCTLAAIDTPKHIGTPVAKVKAVSGSKISVNPFRDVVLNNGDGLGFFDAQGRFTGFRLNRVDGDTLFPLGRVNVATGAVLYRNLDVAYDRMLASTRDRRTIPVEMTLRRAPRGMVLDIVDNMRGLHVSVCDETDLQPARTDQTEARMRTLSRLGDTLYAVKNIYDNLGDCFVPMSMLADLRRRAIEALDSAARATYPITLRRTESDFTTPSRLTFHDNVANTLAAKFYTRHGTQNIQPALEVMPVRPDEDVEVMCSRYCLRRELGACLLSPEGKRLPEPLYLVNTTGTTKRRFKLKFDCPNCQMRVIREGLKDAPKRRKP